jgi:MFS family permease
MAVAFGPVIGGAILKGISWQWIFWVNVPVGVTLVALAPGRLTESFGPRRRIDAVGRGPGWDRLPRDHLGSRAGEHRRLGKLRGAHDAGRRHRADRSVLAVGARRSKSKRIGVTPLGSAVPGLVPEPRGAG